MVLLWGCAATAHAQPLRELAAAYANAQRVVVDARSTTQSPPNRIRYRASVRSDGSFLSEHFMEAYGGRNGSEWDEMPGYFVAFDNGVMRVAEPTGTEFRETPMPKVAEESPGPVQWMYCPWPVLPKVCEWLEGAPDLAISERDGESTATSVQRQLSISWRGTHLTRYLRGVEATGRYQAVRYDGFGQVGKPEWLPRVAVESLRTGSTPDGKPIGQEVGYAIAASLDANAAPVFDASALKSNLYDAASGNVSDPSGRVLYNKRQVESALRQQGLWAKWRPYGIAGIATVVLVALIAGIRKFRA